MKRKTRGYIRTVDRVAVIGLFIGVLHEYDVFAGVLFGAMMILVTYDSFYEGYYDGVDQE